MREDVDDVEAFGHEVEAFYAGHARPAPPRRGWGDGPDDVVGAALSPGREEAADIEEARAFQRALYDAGLAWIDGPPELGGRGGGAEHVAALRRIARRHAEPDRSAFMIGQRIVAPAIAAHGSADQRRRWLRAIWRGDSIACQLFSEPDAGSDLASLRCRAVPVPGPGPGPDGRGIAGWRVTGQKVWSSGAHLSDVGELLARTEPDPGLRHRGLSMFLVDMRTPGITVRPLRQMNGNAHFNEVHFDDVLLPADALLGERGAGWQVAQASLTSERDLGPEDHGLFLDPVDRLLELARVRGAAGDPVARQALADTWARHRIGRWLDRHVEHAAPAVRDVGVSLTKLYEAQSMWRLAQRAAAVVGPGATADTGAWGEYAWAHLVLGVHSQRIAGGTDEIQRNIIGERGLGLPREPRPPRDH